MAEPAKRRRKPTVEAVPEAAHAPEPDVDADVPAADAPHAPATCPVAWCPICLAVTAVQPVKPEAVEHLLRAGTELFLAMRAVIDARGDDADAAMGGARRPGDGDGLEKIDIG
ncbi:MAG TPA: hypothetical protein VF044_08535 [Actinomycetota bacterium]